MNPTTQAIHGAVGPAAARLLDLVVSVLAGWVVAWSCNGGGWRCGQGRDEAGEAWVVCK